MGHRDIGVEWDSCASGGGAMNLARTGTDHRFARLVWTVETIGTWRVQYFVAKVVAEELMENWDMPWYSEMRGER